MCKPPSNNSNHLSVKDTSQSVSWLGKGIIGLISIYRYLISPLMGSHCRYLPTCSEYAIEAIKVHGNIKGIVFSIGRIVRCHPFASGGVDEVPPVKDK